MKFRPVRIDEKPDDERRRAPVGMTLVFDENELYGV